MAKIAIVNQKNIFAANNLSAELWTLPDAVDIATGQKDFKLTENEGKIIARVFNKVIPEFAIAPSLQRKIKDILDSNGSINELNNSEKIQAKIVLNGVVNLAKEMAEKDTQEAIKKLLELSSLLDIPKEDVSKTVEQFVFESSASKEIAEMVKPQHEDLNQG